jgi:hypothetical protein
MVESLSSIVGRQGLERTWRRWKQPKQFHCTVHPPEFAQLGLHAKLVKLWQQQQQQQQERLLQ